MTSSADADDMDYRAWMTGAVHWTKWLGVIAGRRVVYFDRRRPPCAAPLRFDSAPLPVDVPPEAL